MTDHRNKPLGVDPPMIYHHFFLGGMIHQWYDMIVGTPSQHNSLVSTNLNSGRHRGRERGGGPKDMIAWDEIFTSVGECSAGPTELFFLANGGSYY